MWLFEIQKLTQKSKLYLWDITWGTILCAEFSTPLWKVFHLILSVWVNRRQRFSHKRILLIYAFHMTTGRVCFSSDQHQKMVRIGILSLFRLFAQFHAHSSPFSSTITNLACLELSFIEFKFIGRARQSNYIVISSHNQVCDRWLNLLSLYLRIFSRTANDIEDDLITTVGRIEYLSYEFHPATILPEGSAFHSLRFLNRLSTCIGDSTWKKSTL